MFSMAHVPMAELAESLTQVQLAIIACMHDTKRQRGNMTQQETLIMFLRKISIRYPEHMLCYFAANAALGRVLPFLAGLVQTLTEIDSAIPGYANEILDRIALIKGTGVAQYEAILQILAEVYVTQGIVSAADRDDCGKPQVVHEPGERGQKNPECEAFIAGRWCAVEVKAPKLIEYGRHRATNPWQVTARLPREVTDQFQKTLPRDNPVKDFLVSADSKFAAYEMHRNDALRILVIVWDDFCNEPISALISPVSGLLTQKSFHRDASDNAVTYKHIDGIIVVRHQHQIIRATRCEPLADNVVDAMKYHHNGFPAKTFIAVPGGRAIPDEVLTALNTVPQSKLMGAENQPAEMIMWIGGSET